MAHNFQDFDAAHPEIWVLFRNATFQVMERGFRNYGAKSILERIRWHTSIEQGRRDFKVNNNFAPFYARKFHDSYPEFSGFFRTRTQKAHPEIHDEETQRVGSG